MFDIKRSDFPENFVFGTATSSYQIEGTSFGDCGPSHWDSFAKAGGTVEKEDGRIACAHMQHWQSDLDLIADCGLSAYRFSTAWPRVMPTGKGQVSDAGLGFYDRLVDGILERGLEAHLTLYHWDLPKSLADKGGWANPDTPKYFADFAQLISQRIGDRINSIATINEPWCVAWLSHFLGHHAPGETDLAVATKAMHNVLLAHGLATIAMRSNGQEQIGIVLNMEYCEPASENEEDVLAASLQDGLYNRWYADAIFKADYPSDILEHVALHLPEDWREGLEAISQPIDWLGLNYYTRSVIRHDGTKTFPYVQTVNGPNQKTDMGWEIYPEGLSYFLERITRDYGTDVPLVVTENGMANADQITDGVVIDTPRVDFFNAHLNATLKAIKSGVRVKGYFAWSLLDNFEWAFGYKKRFGLVHVNYDTQRRTPKASYEAFKSFLKA